MEVSKNEPSLWVLFDGQTIGRLTYEPMADEFSFTYDSLWTSANRFSISPHIRIGEQPQKGAVTRFLENLLPEGEALRSLAQILKVRPDNLYALISAIGAETAGALTFSREPKEFVTQFRPISRDELIDRIKVRKDRSIINWDGRPRLSLAGVQEKLPIVERDGEYGLGDGKIASTHILKFGNEKAPHLVLNEYFCMRLARIIGLRVAECEMIDLGEKVLKITRFDRKWHSRDQVIRTHVIDGCQALDLPPKMKYERFLGDENHVADITGPATLKNIYDFCAHTLTPAKSQLDILHWIVFNLLIGNCDNHIKNVSFFVTDDGTSLTPFYDLVSVSMYPQFGQALAFQIGDTFVASEINAYHLAEMASELQLKKTFVATQLRKITQNTLKAVDVLEFKDLAEDEVRFAGELRSGIIERCQRFLVEIPEIAK